jgi:5'(3')-deoxyribonucleotidase
MLPRIYCDMDGVLADFKSGAVKATGMSINKWQNIPSSKKKWEPIHNTPNFWANLPWMPGGQRLWSFIEKYNAHILSAYVEDSFDPNCIPGKKQWLRKNIGLSDSSRINLVRRKDKQLYAKRGNKRGEPAILIDDYEKNIRDFTNAGGIGIYHTDTSKTISQLKRLGF